MMDDGFHGNGHLTLDNMAIRPQTRCESEHTRHCDSNDSAFQVPSSNIPRLRPHPFARQRLPPDAPSIRQATTGRTTGVSWTSWIPTGRKSVRTENRLGAARRSCTPTTFAPTPRCAHHVSSPCRLTEIADSILGPGVHGRELHRVHASNREPCPVPE